MADEKQNQFTMLALVGIVAVVGIVGLTMMIVGVGNGRVGGTEGVIYTSDANIAGDVKAPVSYSPDSGMACDCTYMSPYNEGFTEEDRNGYCRFISGMTLTRVNCYPSSGQVLID